MFDALKKLLGGGRNENAAGHCGTMWHLSCQRLCVVGSIVLGQKSPRFTLIMREHADALVDRFSEPKDWGSKSTESPLS